jgi:hypothetical protein
VSLGCVSGSCGIAFRRASFDSNSELNVLMSFMSLVLLDLRNGGMQYPMPSCSVSCIDDGMETDE